MGKKKEEKIEKEEKEIERKKKRKEKRKSKIIEKKKRIEEILNEIKSYKSIAIVDLNKLPARILQNLRGKINGKFIFEKKSILERAIKIYNPKLLKFFDGQKMLILSNDDPITLYRNISSNPEKRYAKENEIAEFDIIVPAGETNLTPGPVLSELKQAKIDVRVSGGKLVIGKDSIVARKGEKISSLVASVLQKLDIKPFEVKVRVPVIYSDLIYEEKILCIGEKEIEDEIRDANKECIAISLAAQIPTKESINMFLLKAYNNCIAIAREGNIILPELPDIIKKVLVESNLKAKSLEVIS